MRFGDTPVGDAQGAILAHSLKGAGFAFKKGRVLSAGDVATLAGAGITTVVAARLEAGDVTEDQAAERLARALKGNGLDASAAFTGRVNLYAAEAGLVVLDEARIDQLNLLDEAVTLATLPAFASVAEGQMVATVKIIPYGAPEATVAAAEALASTGTPLLRVAPYRAPATWLVQSSVPGMKPSILDKTTEVTRARIEALGGTLLGERRIGHHAGEFAAAMAEGKQAGAGLVLAIGASAITDRRDELPAGLCAAGGQVLHLGMPVDPGNLLLLGNLDGAPVLGLPGCARSPKLNGVDWVLQRLAAGIEVTRTDIMRMGVGGLLTEIPSRPLPRDLAVPRAPRVAALVLAAGRSKRMGRNKLLTPVEGGPLALRAIDAALASQAGPVIVVLGHESERVRSAIGERAVRLVEAPDYAEGLSASLKAGLAALPDRIDAVIVCLADMPRVSAPIIDRLIAAFNPAEGRRICVPIHKGQRGNPVLWDLAYVPEMATLTGDRGAKPLLERHADVVCEVEMTDDAVLLDLDTPEALAAYESR